MFLNLKILGITCLIVPSAAMSGVTVLSSLPVAEVLAHRAAAFAYTGDAGEDYRRYDHSHGLEIGLFDKAEISFDNDFQDNIV